MDKILSPIKQRIEEYLDYKGITKELFFSKTGISPSNFKGNGKKSELGGEKIVKILTFYTDLNSEWLLLGQGEMILEEKLSPKLSPKLSRNREKDEKNCNLNCNPNCNLNREKGEKNGKVNGKVDREKDEKVGSLQLDEGGIPLIPIEAAAGMMSGNNVQIMNYDCERYVIPAFQSADFLIQIKGDSMQPKYYSGDIVACKRLKINTFFQWNKPYVIDSEQGVLVKRVCKGNDPKHIKLVSDNKEYDPFELSRSEIYSVALVMGVVRAE